MKYHPSEDTIQQLGEEFVGTLRKLGVRTFVTKFCSYERDLLKIRAAMIESSTVHQVLTLYARTYRTIVKIEAYANLFLDDISYAVVNHEEKKMTKTCNCPTVNNELDHPKSMHQEERLAELVLQFQYDQIALPSDIQDNLVMI